MLYVFYNVFRILGKSVKNSEWSDSVEIKRDFYLQKLIDRNNNHLIKIVTGIRRCGKSYLLNHLFKNYLLDSGVDDSHIIMIALDDDENSDLLDSKKLRQYINEKILDNDLYYLLLDEIQLVSNFEGLLNGLLRKENLDIYVTGSNSKFLSSDIITEFRGRGEDIKVYPLSYYEFMSVYEGDKLDGWVEYITYGGLPLVVSMKTDERKANYLKEQQNNVYINDVIERNNIKNDTELVTLVEIISSSIGSLSNPKKLSDTFKSVAGINIDPKTISLYLKYLEEAFLIEKDSRYDVKGKKYMSTPYKFYFTDLGLRNSFINFRQHEETHIMENVIYLELKRRGFSVDVGVVELKERKENEITYKQLEVDFIANKGNNKIYIQSAYAMQADEKIDQEERLNPQPGRAVIETHNIIRSQENMEAPARTRVEATTTEEIEESKALDREIVEFLSSEDAEDKGLLSAKINEWQERAENMEISPQESSITLLMSKKKAWPGFGKYPCRAPNCRVSLGNPTARKKHEAQHSLFCEEGTLITDNILENITGKEIKWYVRTDESEERTEMYCCNLMRWICLQQSHRKSDKCSGLK